MAKHRFILGIGMLALTGASTAATAAPTGRVTAGWPVPAPATERVHSLAGGPVILADGLTRSLAAAWRADGTRRWVNSVAWGCGNCALVQPDASLPGGPFGPLGPGALRFVNASGRSITGPLAILADGTRISTSVDAGIGASLTRAVRGGAELWERSDPYFSDTFESTGLVVSNGATLVRGFGSTTTPTIALDPATGDDLWQVPNARPLVAFGSGVIVQLASGDLAAHDGPGGPTATFDRRWRAALDPSFPPLADPGAGRLYVTTTAGIDVYDTGSGQRVRSIPWAAALALVDGTLLARVQLSARPAVRAFDSDGTRLWTHETPTRVAGATLLADGTVALITEGVGDLRELGLVMRMNPTVAPRSADRLRIHLDRTSFRVACDDPGRVCALDRSRGATLRIDSPGRARLSLRVVDATGAVVSRWTPLSVPTGRSFTRVSVGRSGAMRVQIRRDATGLLLVDRAVTVTH